MSNITFTDIVQSFTGGSTTLFIQGSDPTSVNSVGGTVTITGGTGTGTGDGGNIALVGGTDGGSGTQGSITFSALDSSSAIPFNETGNVDLDNSFTATSIIGALNELQGSSGSSTFTSLTDTPANYTGQASTLVTVNAGETGLEFSTLQSGTNNNQKVTLPSTIDYGVSTIAELISRVATSDYIFIQSGTYTVISSLNLQDNTIIQGSGNTTILRGNVSGFINGGNNVTIRDCVFESTGSLTTFINLTGVTNVNIINCVFSDCLLNTPILIQTNCENILIKNCVFTNNLVSCITITDSNNINIKKNSFDSTNTPIGINLSNTDNVLISDNFIEERITISNASNIIIFNNVITTIENLILLENTLDSIIISDNIISGSVSGNGILLENSASGDILIKSNIIKNCDLSGILIGSTSIDFQIIGNTIKDNQEEGINTISKGIISSNILTNNGIDGSSYNINIGNNSDEIIISNNTITGISINNPRNILIGTGNNDTVQVKTNSITATYSTTSTITPYEDIITFTGTSETLTFNDLTKVSCGHKTTINATGALTIDFTSFTKNEGSITLAASEYCTAIWNGNAWEILSKSPTIISTGTRPHFIGTGVDQLVPNTVQTILIFGTITSNAGIIQNGSGTFDVPEPGYYHVQASFSATLNGGNIGNAAISSSGTNASDAQGFIQYLSTNQVNAGFSVNATIRTTTTNIGGIFAFIFGQSQTLVRLNISIIQVAPL